MLGCVDSEQYRIDCWFTYRPHVLPSRHLLGLCHLYKYIINKEKNQLHWVRTDDQDLWLARLKTSVLLTYCGSLQGAYIIRLIQVMSIVYFARSHYGATRTNWTILKFFNVLYYIDIRQINFLYICSTVKKKKKNRKQTEKRSEAKVSVNEHNRTWPWLDESNLRICSWKLKKNHDIPQRWHSLAYIRILFHPAQPKCNI